MDPLIKSQLLYQLSYAPIEIPDPQVREGPACSKAAAGWQAETGTDFVLLFPHAAPVATAQFLSLSTSLFWPIQGIIARNFAPISSIGCALARARIALNDV